MRKKQLERKLAKDEHWELSFLATETWRNLRMTCRGFTAYCRSVFKYADNAPEGSMRKVYAVNPAHSNSSILEAWFSAVRNTKSDSTPSYAHFVANRDMKKANADRALKKK